MGRPRGEEETAGAQELGRRTDQSSRPQGDEQHKSAAEVDQERGEEEEEERQEVARTSQDCSGRESRETGTTQVQHPGPSTEDKDWLSGIKNAKKPGFEGTLTKSKKESKKQKQKKDKPQKSKFKRVKV